MTPGNVTRKEARAYLKPRWQTHRVIVVHRNRRHLDFMLRLWREECDSCPDVERFAVMASDLDAGRDVLLFFVDRKLLRSAALAQALVREFRLKDDVERFEEELAGNMVLTLCPAEMTLTMAAESKDFLGVSTQRCYTTYEPEHRTHRQ